jgi:hypothetical protein
MSTLFEAFELGSERLPAREVAEMLERRTTEEIDDAAELLRIHFRALDRSHARAQKKRTAPA